MIPQLATWSGVNDEMKDPFMDPGVSQFLELLSNCSIFIGVFPCIGVLDGASPGVGVEGADLGGLEFEFSLELLSRGLLRAAWSGDMLWVVGMDETILPGMMGLARGSNPEDWKVRAGIPALLDKDWLRIEGD